MLSQGTNCRDKEAHVTTNETGRRQKFYRDKVFSIKQEIKEQYRKNIVTDKFMLQHNEEQKAEFMSRHNPLLSQH